MSEINIKETFSHLLRLPISYNIERPDRITSWKDDPIRAQNKI